MKRRVLEIIVQQGNRAEQEPREWGAEQIVHALTDPAKMEELYRFYHPLVFSMSMHWLMNREDAEDATSETFLRMIQHLRRFEWRSRPFSGWLRRILLNVIKDRWRRGNKIRFESLDLQSAEGKSLLECLQEEGESQSERILRLERFHALRIALADLSPKYQDVLMLRFFEELPPREIAFITGANVGIVKWQLHQGTKRLRKILEKSELFKREI